MWCGQFTVKLQDGGAFTPPLGATIHMQQKIPELTFEDFSVDVTKKIPLIMAKTNEGEVHSCGVWSCKSCPFL